MRRSHAPTARARAPRPRPGRAPALLGIATATAALVALAGCRTPRGTTELPYLTRLDLAGVKSVDADELAAKLATQGPDTAVGLAHHWYPLDPDALQVDKRRVEAFYRERGYYQATVERTELTPDGPGRARLTLHVREGPPVRVTVVTVTGLEEAGEARHAAGKLPIAPGDVFTEAAYDAAKARLLGSLRGSGWALAEVTQRAQVLPEAGTAEVVYEVVPGSRYRFGRIFVAGSGAVSRAEVVGQAATEVHPGDWYDEGRLAKAQARVFDMGVFAGVRVTRGTPDPEQLTVPVVVTVREAPFRTLRAGPGVGIQQSRLDATGQATWIHRNWLGDLRRLQADARAGWAWIPGTGRNAPVGLLGAQLDQPRVIAGRIDLSLKLSLEKGLERTYGFWSERLRLAAPVRLGRHVSFVPSANLELYQLRDLVTAAGAAAPNPTQFRSCPDGICLLAYLEQRLAWDGRDDPLVTRRGAYLAVAVQEGVTLGGYGYRYLRFLPEARFFLPLGRDTVVALRARGGAIVPVAENDPPPVVALFFSGGANAMRGYGWQRLSPMELQGTQWVATGGNGLLDGSLELRRRLVGDWGGVLFVDGGSVTLATSQPGQWRDLLDPTRIQYAGGLGLRYASPFGPLRLDVAARLPTDWRAGVAFSDRFPPVPFGTHREPIMTVNVSLGEAF